MPHSPIKRTHVGTDKVDRALEDLRTPVNLLLDGILADVKFLTEDGSKDLVFTAGVTKVLSHKLGRNYKGFLVAYRGGPYDPYVDTSVDIDDASGIALVTSNNVTLRILIF